MPDDKRDHVWLSGVCCLAPGDILRWSFAGITVLSAYVAGVAGFYNHRVEPERFAGSPPAIMLEFAAGPTAPDLQAFSETIRSAMQADASEPPPEPVVKEALPLSGFVEKQQSEQKGKKAKNRPEEKVAKKPRQKQPEKLKDDVAVGEQNRKAATPDVAAESGKTFAARNNSRSEGFNGKSHKAWADRVYRRIQGVGRRMQRQLPRARGIAYISFTYDASGRISAASITRSSGDSGIDQLALRIVEHSSPLPVPPDAGRKIVPVRIN